VDEESTVRLFVMGGGTGRRNEAGRMDHGGFWRDAMDWPLPETQFTNFYLHGNGRLSPDLPQEDESSLAYNYDPRNPVPTIGGTVTSGEPIMDWGAYDQKEEPRFFGSRPPYLPLASRPDILVFETPSLERDVEVTGPIMVRLWISSNCPDTDFTAKLLDVYPPNPDYPQGFAMNITDGIMRCRYRNSWERPEMMKPGEVYEITVEPFPTSNLFRAGHRIRLDISSSNFPHFDINPNTGEPEGLSQRMIVATNSVCVDRGRPSHIVLPIIPR
jgi:putative CocE/NonD family hydrolase